MRNKQYIPIRHTKIWRICYYLRDCYEDMDDMILFAEVVMCKAYNDKQN